MGALPARGEPSRPQPSLPPPGCRGSRTVRSPPTTTGASRRSAATSAPCGGAWWTWSPGNGTFDLQIPRNVIGPDSTVVVTACGINAGGARFVGAAPFRVSSIAPGSGVVTFKIDIGWSSPLPMRTDVLVFN